MDKSEPISHHDVERLTEALARKDVAYLFIGKGAAVLHGFAQHPLDGVVVDAELRGDGVHPPALDEVVAQDLRPELVADRHRVERSARYAGANSPTNRRTSPVKTYELADRTCAEVALHPGSAARCASSLGGRVGGHRRARLAPENSLA